MVGVGGRIGGRTRAAFSVSCAQRGAALPTSSSSGKRREAERDPRIHSGTVGRCAAVKNWRHLWLQTRGTSPAALRGRSAQAWGQGPKKTAGLLSRAIGMFAGSTPRAIPTMASRRASLRPDCSAFRYGPSFLQRRYLPGRATLFYKQPIGLSMRETLT